jgi:hypothetical protein
MIEDLFTRDDFRNEIESIQNTRVFSEQEKYYRTIAKGILHKIPEFVNVTEEKSGYKGVPFDLIFLNNNEIGIVELKGSKKYFNFPDNTQFSRLKIIIRDFHFENFELKAYLIQINLDKSKYIIYGHKEVLGLIENIDINLGQKTPTQNILNNIYSFIQKNKAST